MSRKSNKNSVGAGFTSLWSTPLALCLVTGFGLVACSSGEQPAPPPPPPSSQPATETPTEEEEETSSPPPATTSVETSFADVTASSGIGFTVNIEQSFQNDGVDIIFPHGVAAGDYDNDGLIDLFIARADRGPNRLYRNLGNMQFEDMAETAGVAFTDTATTSFRHGAPAFVDLNGDGNLDIFIPGFEQDPTLLYLSNGDGTFTQSQISGLDAITTDYNHSPAFGDYDMDGDLDLFLGHWGTPRDFDNPGDTEHLWRNDSDASGIRFTSVSLEAGIAPSIVTLMDPLITLQDFDNTFTPTFARINDDLFPDIVVASDFNSSQIFINQGDGTFSNETDFDVLIDGNGMGSALGDYDGDGDLDWFVSSILASPDGAIPPPDQLSRIGNRLYRNNDGVFEDVTDEAGVDDGGWGWGSCFFDFENDGVLDLYHTNGWPFGDQFGGFATDESRAFISNGEGAFTDGATPLGLIDGEEGRGIVCADFDNDGDVDILQLHRNEVNAATLWENQYSGPNAFLRVTLVGDAPNTQALGARITVEVNGQILVREVIIGGTFTAHNPAVQYFGLGDVEAIDRLNVTWPNGDETSLANVDVNQALTITQ